MRCISAILFCLLAINSNAQELAANNNQPLLNELQSLNASNQALTFEENGGQVRDQNWNARPDVLFSGVSNGLNFHLRNCGISYQIVSFEESADNSEREIGSEEQTPPDYSIYRVDLNWVNANDNIKVVTGNTLKGYNNYYNVPEGNDPALMVKKFEDVRFRNVWPGIDLLYFSNAGTLESDWLLERAEDYTQIAFEIVGAEVSANDDGYLIMQTPFGEIREGKLAVYQHEKLLDAQWVIEPSARGTVVSFEVEGFEPEKPMRIDPPTSLWSTFYGGTGADEGQACTSDGNGNLYMSGRTNSTTSIATSGGFLNYALGGSYDAFIVKFNANGARQWATYYGWSGWDEGSACTTDNLGNVFLAGRTNSTAMVGSDGAHQPFAGGNNDAYIAKFNTNGVRQWGTFYGGTGSDMGTGCATDSNNNVYLTGRSLSNNNIGTPGSHQQFRFGSDDAFLVKFSPGGVRQWGTYYGGGGQDVALSIAVSSSDLVHIGGYTASSSNMATAGTYQPDLAGGQFSGFLAQFNTDGVRQWGTYYSGTSGWTWVLDCDVDATGNIYISGLTQSPVNIASPGSHQQFFGGGNRDGFLAKITPNGTRTWGTYFGGGGNDDAFGCTVSADNRVYIVGGTSSTDGIASDDATQPENGGGTNDAYLAQFDADGAFLWGSYFGGSGNDIAYGCHANSDGIYMTGFTGSTNVFATPGAHQPGYGGGASDAFFGALESAGCTEEPAQPGAISGDLTACEGDENIYSVAAVAGATSYTWTLPNGWTGNSSTNSIDVTAGSNGGTISVTANNNCGSSTAQTLSVSVNQAPAQPGAISGDVTSCAGDENTYSVSAVTGATSYTWTLPNGWTGSSTTNSIDVTAGNNGGTISVVANNNNCGSSTAQTLSVSVNEAPNQPGAISGDVTSCEGDENNYSVSAVTGATSYTWTLPNGWIGSSTTNSINATAGSNGGTISVTANNSCGSSTAQTLSASVDEAPNQPGAISGEITFCEGDESTCSVSAVDGATSYTWTLPNGWTGNSTSNSIDVTAGENGGTVSVVANNNCGSSESSAQMVESHPLPMVSFELDSSIVCNSFGDFTLTAGLPEGGTYSGTGVSDDTFSPADAGPGTHVITYTYVDENNCSNSSEQEIVVEVCTDVNDLNHSSVLIYPNPFRNSLVLMFDENHERVIEFHNAIGQIVHTLQGKGLRMTVDAEHLAPGIYFIRISGEVKVHRVVRSH